MDKETEVKLKKWLKQNYFCAQYFINKNKEQSEKSPNDWFNAGYKSEEFVCVFHRWGDSCFKFQINKILPDNYNEEIEKLKYAQILQDVINNSKAELKGIPLDGFGQMIRIPDLIVSKLEKIIAEKFNVKIKD